MTTSIGDVIPVLAPPVCDDAAITYLRTRPDARADLISVDELPDEAWEMVPTLVEQAIDTLSYLDPFS